VSARRAYLLGGIAIERVNQVWCSDVTYIPMASAQLLKNPTRFYR
jgi:transposase InsO family protein